MSTHTYNKTHSIIKNNVANNIAQKTARNRFQSSVNPCDKQQGLTLIEILITMVIALFLLLGIMQVFQGSRVSYQLQNSVGRLQENARFSMDIMAQNIGMAGYTSDDSQILPAINAAGTADNVTPNAALGLSVAATNASDTISISYESATNCLGNPTGGIANETYFIGGPDLNDLMCTGNGVTDIMANGVESLQILYGVDTQYNLNEKGGTNPGDGISDVYVTAGNVTNWLGVRSVRLAMLVSTVESAGSGVDNNTYVLLNTPPVGPFGDTLMRRVFTRTIPIRNSDVNPL